MCLEACLENTKFKNTLNLCFRVIFWYKDSYKNQEKGDSVINGEEEELPDI